MPPWQPLAAQSTQGLPALPQAPLLFPVWQTRLTSQQPVQWFDGQLPPHPSGAPLHLPMHSGTHWQVPDTHFRLVTVQFVHEPPATPQAALVVPAWQCPLASQQPAQVLAEHVPPQPSLSPAHLLAQLGTHVQLPPLQVGVGLAQLRQSTPPAPQAEALLPGRQRPSWQQPPQVFVVQGLPQPSSSPWHFPTQLGVQTPSQV